VTVEIEERPQAMRKLVPQGVVTDSSRRNGVLLGEVFDAEGEISHNNANFELRIANLGLPLRRSSGQGIVSFEMWVTADRNNLRLRAILGGISDCELRNAGDCGTVTDDR
jgi:hypothetical protein